jgi:hypothetical protein
MTTPISSHKPRSSYGWDISVPVYGTPAPLSPGHTITVTVTDDGSGNTGYIAAVYDPSGPTPAAIVPPCTPLATSDGGDTYTAQIPVTIPPNDQTVIVYPQPNPIGPVSQAVTIQSGSSGSSGSDSGDPSLAAAARAAVFQPGRPVPVSLSAEFGAPPELGGPRVEAAILVYSGAPGFERCWFSQPIDLRSAGADPALWMLERTDARTWLLRLRRGGFDLVVYRHTSAAEKDGSLPVRLHVEAGGNGADAEWPQTVTISPAP